MTNNEYQTLGMMHHMLLEFRDQRNKQAELLAREREPQPVYPVFDNEILSYPLFTNPGCSDLSATELMADGIAEEQCRRWRFFFSPAPDKLPHESQWQSLNQQLSGLKHRYRNTSAPRLAALAIAVFAIVALVARGHLLLPIIPILFLAAYWLYSESHLRKARHALLRHLQEIQALYTQRENLQLQLDSLPLPADMSYMQDCYTQAIARLLQNSLARLLPLHEIQNPADTLHKHRWQGFLSASWAYQQLPLHPASNLNQIILDEKNPGMFALHSDSRGKQTVFRMQYLHMWILTERGILSGEACYDRITDAILYEQHELLPYTGIRRIHFVERNLPEYPQLKALLPDNLHRRHLRQPLGILSVETVSGNVHTCAFPSASATQQHDGWLKTLGLQTDMTELNRQLHKRTLSSATAV